MKNAVYNIYIYYFVAAILLYPIIAHILMYQLGYMSDRLPHGPLWIFIQIFLSGPLLIVIGSLLYFRFGKAIANKVFGVILFLIGLYWLFTLISDIIREAA